MSYNYADRVVMVEALSIETHPSRYELCADHAASLTVPRGWRMEASSDVAVRPVAMDVIRLADRMAERLAGRPSQTA
jgi:hypothetical protein